MNVNHITLNGHVSTVWENPLTGHMLVTIAADSGVPVRALFTDGAHVVMGERLTIEGQFTHHAPYGRYFLPRSVTARPPEGLSALVDYLTRALEIDSTEAERIVGRFGDDVVEALDRDFGRLREVGIPQDRIKELQKKWKATRMASDVERLCERLGLSPNEKRLFRERVALPADKLAERLREDPFLPYTIFPRASFELADRLRGDLGLPALAPCRLRAALLRCLKRAARSGHTGLTSDQLMRRTLKDLNLDDQHLPALTEALGKLSNDRGVSKRGDSVCLPSLLQAEMDAVSALRGVLATSSGFDPPGKQLTAALQRDKYTFPAGAEDAARFALSTKVCLLDHRGYEAQVITAEAVVRSAQTLRIKTLVAAPHVATAQLLSRRLGTSVPSVTQLLGIASDGHRLYGVDADRQLDAGLVVILGADAFDIELFTALVQALFPATSLVLIGDEAMASPLGPGRPYRDLMAESRVPTRLLHTEADSRTPLGFMRNILSGSRTLAQRRGAGDPVTFLSTTKTEQHGQHALLEQLRAIAEKVLPALGGHAPDSMRFLYPTYKINPTPGEITSFLRSQLSPSAIAVEGLKGLYVGDPLYLSRRIESAPYPVGTRMTLQSADPGPRLSVRHGETKYAVEGAGLEGLEAAFAIPSYLASGDQAPIVALYMPPDLPPYLAHQRLLYSAAALATHHLFLVGDYELISSAVRRPPPAVHSGFGVIFDELKGQTEKANA
jgi:exodeoxyribonuclease V alpha subunit